MQISELLYQLQFCILDSFGYCNSKLYLEAPFLGYIKLSKFVGNCSVITNHYWSLSKTLMEESCLPFWD